jgi:hypothetical protein
LENWWLLINFEFRAPNFKASKPQSFQAAKIQKFKTPKVQSFGGTFKGKETFGILKVFILCLSVVYFQYGSKFEFEY